MPLEFIACPSLVFIPGFPPDGLQPTPQRCCYSEGHKETHQALREPRSLLQHRAKASWAAPVIPLPRFWEAGGFLLVLVEPSRCLWRGGAWTMVWEVCSRNACSKALCSGDSWAGFDTVLEQELQFNHCWIKRPSEVFVRVVVASPGQGAAHPGGWIGHWELPNCVSRQRGKTTRPWACQDDVAKCRLWFGVCFPARPSAPFAACTH